MKNVLLLASMSLVLSCKNQDQNDTAMANKAVVSVTAGQQLFETNNCTACHQIAEKVVGPSLQNIAQIYKRKNASLVSFLKSEAEPIVDPSQYESMKLNLEITKTMSETELKSLEMYILSHLQ